jgi:hypothetical protein
MLSEFNRSNHMVCPARRPGLFNERRLDRAARAKAAGVRLWSEARKPPAPLRRFAGLRRILPIFIDRGAPNGVARLFRTIGRNHASEYA